MQNERIDFGWWYSLKERKWGRRGTSKGQGGEVDGGVHTIKEGPSPSIHQGPPPAAGIDGVLGEVSGGVNIALPPKASRVSAFETEAGEMKPPQVRGEHATGMQRGGAPAGDCDGENDQGRRGGEEDHYAVDNNDEAEGVVEGKVFHTLRSLIWLCLAIAAYISGLVLCVLGIIDVFEVR